MNSAVIENMHSKVRKSVEAVGYRLYDIVFNQVTRTLQIYIDHPGRNITIDDCQRVSNAVGDELDGEESGLASYTLEVSSPGINRVLRRPEHFQWAVGKLAEIDVGTHRVRGFIRKADDEFVLIAAEDGESMIKYCSITKARIAEEIDYGKRR